MITRIIPWMTDGSVHFIESFLRKRNNNLNILEFGSGASTLYFSTRCKSLLTFEHDFQWADAIRKTASALSMNNLTLLCRDAPYNGCILDEIENYNIKKFEIISIDGINRVECLEECVSSNLLTDDGILVLDNTERIYYYGKPYEKYLEILENDYYLINFEQTTEYDVTGWRPPHKWITSVAFKKSNANLVNQLQEKGKNL
jgi:predicted O-methyltransferase YrrM